MRKSFSNGGGPLCNESGPGTPYSTAFRQGFDFRPQQATWLGDWPRAYTGLAW